MSAPVWNHEADGYCMGWGCRSEGSRLANPRPSGLPDGRGMWVGTCAKCGQDSVYDVVNAPRDFPDELFPLFMEAAVGTMARGRYEGRSHVLGAGAAGWVVLALDWSGKGLCSSVVFCSGDLYESAREFVLRELAPRAA